MTTTTYTGSQSAGSGAITNIDGSTSFYDSSTADHATINNDGGYTFFYNASTAGSATITNTPYVFTAFYNSSTADSATITNNDFGYTSFSDTSTAGNATITNIDGGTFFAGTAGDATITNYNGGYTGFSGTSTAGSARLINAGGLVDFSATSGPNGDRKISAGSIEGAGTYYLGSNELMVGSINTSTTVSGTIRDGGDFGGTGASLLKVGTGTLTLSGSNTYTGGTTISEGTFALASAQAAGTGDITFTEGGERLVLEQPALGSAGGTFSNALVDFGAGDTLDLRGLTFAAAATATLNGDTLTVTSGGTSESFVLEGDYTTPDGDPQKFEVVGYNDGTGTLRSAVQFSTDSSPTLDISASDVSGNNNGEFTLGEALTLSFAFSEEVNGFEAGDIALSSGTLVAGSLAQDASDPTRYTAKATFAGPGSVTVADGFYTDLAGQEGTGDSLAVQVVGTPKNDHITGTGDPDTLEGRDGRDTLSGGDGSDTLLGGNDSDSLSGGAQDDRIVGGLGTDRLNGGAGADTLVFDTAPKSNNIDRIMAFVVADDTIALDDAVFTALKDPSQSTPHGLAQGAFYVGSRAHDADDRIIYNASTGALSYDVDGSGRGGAVQFATFDPKVSGLSFSDFEVI